MPASYSGDLRRRVSAALWDGGRSALGAARRFAVGRSTVRRCLEAARGP